MKKSILLFTLAIGVFSGAVISGKEIKLECTNNTKCAAKAIIKLKERFPSATEDPKKFLDDKESALEICDKGSSAENKTTIRSYRGKICKQSPYWSAYALLVCSKINTNKFKGSHCHIYAKKKFLKKVTDLEGTEKELRKKIENKELRP